MNDETLKAAKNENESSANGEIDNAQLDEVVGGALDACKPLLPAV